MTPDTTAMSKGKDNVPDVPPDTGKAMAFPQFRQTMMAPYRTGDITHSRVAVLRDLGYAVQVPLDYFKTAAVDIRNIGKSLEIPLYRLSMKFQSKRTEPEDELFKPLSTLFSKVVKEILVPASKNTARPDAYLEIVHRKKLLLHSSSKGAARMRCTKMAENTSPTYFVPSRLQVTTSLDGTEPRHQANWTTRDISDFNADASRGRRARIFEDCRKSQNGKLVKAAEPVVLKDSWRDRKTEDRILEQIFADLADHKGVKQVDEARKSFLTVLAAGDVKVDGEIHRWYPWPSPHGRPTYHLLLDEGLPPIFPYIPSPTVHPTIHHRIHTHPEVGQPIYELRSVDAVFKTLQDAHKAHEVEDVHQVMTTYFNSEKEMPPVEALAHTEPLKNLHSISAEYLTSAAEYSRGVILAPAPRRSTA
ncbi:hypothetical protein EDC04DRAFT_3144445 [Pisolithus marmoratus]|nr:hypothetical protein EDC04DRAFT_3144445 [Pisolithus marmoratus]